jgi:hypothetical protein
VFNAEEVSHIFMPKAGVVNTHVIEGPNKTGAKGSYAIARAIAIAILSHLESDYECFTAIAK